MQNWLEKDPSGRVAARLICVADFLSVVGITRSFVISKVQCTLYTKPSRPSQNLSDRLSRTGTEYIHRGYVSHCARSFYARAGANNGIMCSHWLPWWALAWNLLMVPSWSKHDVDTLFEMWGRCRQVRRWQHWEYIVQHGVQHSRSNNKSWGSLSRHQTRYPTCKDETMPCFNEVSTGRIATWQNRMISE